MVLNYTKYSKEQIVIKSPILCNYDYRINDKIHNYIDEPCLCFCKEKNIQFRNHINQLLVLHYNKLPIRIDNVSKYIYTNLEKLIFIKRKNMHF